MPTLRPPAPPRRASKQVGRPRTSARIAKKLSSKPIAHPWTNQIAQLQRGFALNQMELAGRVLNCSLRSLLLWNSGRTPNPHVLIRLNELTRLYHALAQLMPAKDIGPWMKQTNAYLDPLTPLEILSRGEIDRLWHIIHNVGSGMPT